MRHAKGGRRFDMPTSQRLAMFRTITQAVIRDGGVQTTQARAKEVQPLVDKMITLGKANTVHARRQAFTVLNDLNDLYETLGQGVPAKYPLFGRDAHRTRAGIHADGLNKFWPMYAPFNVPALLGRPLDLSLTKDSGVAGLIFLIRQHTGTELAKDHAGLRALHAALTAAGASAQYVEIPWADHAFDAIPGGLGGQLSLWRTEQFLGAVLKR